ncbi:hypothetical protein JCM10449v2_000149 [Rhodotorula kratochvilovae]
MLAREFLVATPASDAPAQDASTEDGTAPAVHLVVILHGLFGSPSHVGYLASALKREAALHSSDGPEVVVLVAQSNGLSSGHLYDGIDVCAVRVVEEIDAEVRRLAWEGRTVERFSMVGYSLGGLVARYAVGLLDSRTPSFFSATRPCSFTTFASPAIGIPSYPSFWSRFFRGLGARLLSRTGRQLYERDEFLPSTRFDVREGEEKPRRWGHRKGRGREGAPLLRVMADPRYSFYQALAKFKRVEVFANTVNDRTVPFPTGGIEEHDPFALALRKAEKLAKERGDDAYAPLDLRDGGLELDFHPGTPILRSFRLSPAPPSSPASPRRRRLLPRIRLPLAFRPITYPVPRPLAYVLILSLPLVYPLVLSFLIARSLVHIEQSGRRIRRARKGVEGGRDGWLQRVGLSVEEALEEMQVDNPEMAAGLGPAGRAGEVSSGGDKQGGADAVDGRHSPASSAGSSAALLPIVSADAAREGPNPTSRSPSSSPASSRSPTDPALSPSQLFQIRQLNALPNLTKHFVRLIDSEYAHGALICRNPKHPAQSRKEVVNWWAGRFEV